MEVKRRPTLVKQRTVAIDRDEVDFKVLEFKCLDSSVLTSLGKHCKQTDWRLAVGSRTVSIRLKVDRSVVGTHEVSVHCDGLQVFPVAEGSPAHSQAVQERGPLKADFVWRHPFRGTLRGIGKEGMFEIRPQHLVGEAWYRATLKQQLEDGTFQAMVYMPDGTNAERQVYYPFVPMSDIRDAASRRPVRIPERHLELTLPQGDPLHPVLTVDGEMITHFFARMSPPPCEPPPMKPHKSRVVLKVNKDRSEVSAVSPEVSYSKLKDFLTSEVKAVGSEANRSKHSWTFQVGPFAEHEVTLSRSSRSNKVFTLTVDKEIMAESTAEDIDSREDWWECQFRLAGEKSVDWDVHETDVDGNALDSKGFVTQASKFSKDCVVSFLVTEASLARATLHVDKVEFQDLPQVRENSLRMDRDQVNCSPESLRQAYGLLTPFKLSEEQHDGFASFRRSVGSLFSSPGGMFMNCCGRPPDPELLRGGSVAEMRPPAAVTSRPQGAASMFGPDDVVLGSA